MIVNQQSIALFQKTHFMKFASALLALLLVFVVLPLHGQTNLPGYVDPGFTAACLTNIGGGVRAIAFQPDGKIIAGGGFLKLVGACADALLRMNTNGTTDTSFTSGLGGFSTVYSLVRLDSGKLLAAGSLVVNGRLVGLARLNENGSLDGSFNITLTNQFVGISVLKVDSAGRILVGGNYGLSQCYFARLLADGSIDTSFAGGTFTGAQLNPLGVTSIAEQADGKILVTGWFTNYNASFAPGVARLNSNGTVDASFAPTITNSLVNQAVVLANGQIMLAGAISTNGSALFRAMARFNADGSVDDTFNVTGIQNYGTIGKIVFEPGGKFVAFHQFGVKRYSANGAVDASFGPEAPGVLVESPVSIFVDAQGRSLVGCEYIDGNATRRRALVRLFGGSVPVPTPPSIDVQPSDVSTFAGSNATFTITASGSAPLIYNWFFGGVNVGGGNNVTFNNVQLGNDGTSIYCLVTNQYGRATSSVVTLHVAAAPLPPTIATNPVSQSVTNPAPISAADLAFNTLGGRTLHLHILGGAAPFPAAGDYDIALAANANTFSIPAGGAMPARAGVWNIISDLGIDTVLRLSDDLVGGNVVKIALLTDGTFEAYLDGVINNQHGTYFLANADGSPVGPTVTFNAGANGTGPFTYQWLFNGTPFPDGVVLLTAAPVAQSHQGETTSTLTLRNVTTADAGQYSVIIANVAGRATSAVATLTVNGYSGGATDGQNPLVKLIQPAASVKFVGSNSVNFAGTASDNAGLAGVFVSFNGGVFVPVTGAANWSATVPLVAGTNTIRVRAVDLAGHAATITRVIIQRPAIPFAGIYNGLFFDTNAPAQESAGAITLSLGADGKFKGKLRQGVKQFSVAGTFDFALSATTAVTRTGQSTLTMALQLVNNRLEGSVTGGTNWTAALYAERAAPVGALAGKYNLLAAPLVPGLFIGPDMPNGYTFAPLTLSTAGRLSGTATLGEGTPAKFLTSVSPNGAAPIYAPLYGGAGVIYGWLTFSNAYSTDLYGILYWFKPGTVGGPLYPHGFTNGLFSSGSRYLAPAAGVPVLRLTNGFAFWGGGNLASTISTPVTLGADHKISASNQLTLTFSAPKGTFTGSFVDPDSQAKRTLNGVVLPKQNIGAGQFMGLDQSGRIFIGNDD